MTAAPGRWLAPRWDDPGARAEAAARWSATGSLRLDGLLADDAATALRDALRACPHPVRAARPPAFAFQYGALGFVPCEACDHLPCGFGRWWWADGAALLSAVTGAPLRPPPDRLVVATLLGRGGFLDPHNDHDGARRCAYVLGLTEARWPADDGGHLEFLAVRDGAVEVVERRPPGWNTLDLFDVTGVDRLHQVSLLDADHERRAITGWLY